MAGKIPSDDMHLEMEEVESLVQNGRNGAVGAGRRPNKSSAGGAVALMDRLSDGNRRRTLSVVACIAIVFAILLFAGTGRVEKIEEDGGAQLADVEGKENVAVGDVSKDPEPLQPNPDPVKQSPAEETPAKDNVGAEPKSEESQTEEPQRTEAPQPEEPQSPETKEETKEEVKEEKPEEKAGGPSFSSSTATGKQKEMIEKWGEWHFWDGDEDNRPTEDYCAKYPNRDIPGDEFPDESWQVDAVYVNHFLNDASKLVERAKEAIYTEYGHGKPLPPEGLMERVKMFHLIEVDMKNADRRPNYKDGGGWTTKRSFDGLERRLLHAMMTNDSFTVVMGGHSAAAGHGNHFKQSYMMQFHEIMDPIFKRLGVKLVTRNIGQGGLGTLQGALGSGSIYGDEVDMMLWDSSMTEPGGVEYDIFVRQALLGGNRVPLIWGGEGKYSFGVQKALHEHADVDIGEYGNGLSGFIEVKDEKQAETIPWAARYLKCTKERQDLCNANKWRTRCWIDRPDVKPPKAQNAHAGSQVGWHPGFRWHKLIGRILAFTVLKALDDALNKWSEVTITGGHPLPDEYWHVTEYYDNIRKKVKDLDPSIGECHKKEGLPSRACSVGLRGHTEFTPRANPEKTSLLSILKPAPNGYIPEGGKMLYEGEDVYNPALHVPEGEVDVLAIVSNRRRRSLAITERDEIDERRGIFAVTRQGSVKGKPRRVAKEGQKDERSLATDIVPGRGWEVIGGKGGYCDGTYDSICGRAADDACLLSGHQDGRAGLLGNELSGWLVMTLKDLKEGLLMIKMETWHRDPENKITAGWKTVNNEARRLGQESPKNYTSDWPVFTAPAESGIGQAAEVVGEGRFLKAPPPEMPETFVFDFAIDGVITSWNKTEWLDHKKQMERVVEVWTLLDDPNFSKKGAKDVELAIRMRGCGRVCTFSFTHVYYA